MPLDRLNDLQLANVSQYDEGNSSPLESVLLIDRLVALLVALTVAAPALTRPECCCVSPMPSASGCCQTIPADGRTQVPACCQSSGGEPSCCRAENSTSRSAVPGPCGCDKCPTSKPVEPFQPNDAPTRIQTIDDLPLATGVVSSLTPVADAARWALPNAIEWRQSHRPPDLQALLCVWTI